MGKKIPEPNNASLADIAFMLLIFFLVTTTMSTDTGIPRVLPPADDERNDKQEEINERNAFNILINSYNQISVEGKLVSGPGVIKDKVKEFFLNPSDKADLSDKKLKKNIPVIGEYMVSEGIVSLQNDRSTEYQVYIEVQDQIVAAINELRDEFVRKQNWGNKFDDLKPKSEKQEAVQKIFPMAFSEAEPRDLSNLGGK
jgi:biopolymer transport protein ExbD